MKHVKENIDNTNDFIALYVPRKMKIIYTVTVLELLNDHIIVSYKVFCYQVYLHILKVSEFVYTIRPKWLE